VASTAIRPLLKRQPAPNKHQRRTDATRRALLKSARQLFARDGFEACRIEDIASATGRTRGAFYAHFKSKEDLFFVMLEQESKQRVEEMRQLLARCRNARERTAALREFYIELNMDRQWAMLIFEFKLFALRHPELRAQLAGTHRRIRASLNLEDIVGRYEEPKRAALEVFLAGLTLEHAYDPRRLSRRDMRELLGTVFDSLKHD
jgi:AcrR family transcriptional regulator